MKNKRSQYPMSKNEQHCLGPCYEQGTFIYHPITLEYFTRKDKPFCPTNGWTYTDPITKKTTNLKHDECINPTENKDTSKEEKINENIFLPRIVFNCKQFLKIYYDINSFDDSLKWIRNSYSPLTTKMRIIDCSWKVWGNAPDFVITDVLIDFYLIVIQKNWIKPIYKHIKKYIKVIDNKIQLDYPDKLNKNRKQFKNEQINYIIQKLLTNNIIYDILLKYIKMNSNEWSNIDSHNDNILYFMIDYLENRILKTIKK